MISTKSKRKHHHHQPPSNPPPTLPEEAKKKNGEEKIEKDDGKPSTKPQEVITSSPASPAAPAAAASSSTVDGAAAIATDPPKNTQPQRQKLSSSEREFFYRKSIMMRELDINVISGLAFRGIPDKPGIRSYYWKVLLGYLPTEHDDWDKVLAKKRADYYSSKKIATSLTAPRPVSEETLSFMERVLAKYDKEKTTNSDNDDKKVEGDDAEKKEENKEVNNEGDKKNENKNEQEQDEDKKVEEKKQEEEKVAEEGEKQEEEVEKEEEEKEKKEKMMTEEDGKEQKDGDNKEEDKKGDEEEKKVDENSNEQEKDDKKEEEIDNKKEQTEDNKDDKKEQTEDNKDDKKEEKDDKKEQTEDNKDDKKEEKDDKKEQTEENKDDKKEEKDDKKEEDKDGKKDNENSEQEEPHRLVPPPPERYISKEQAWRDYYKDDESLNVIEKDVARTLPAMHFFGEECMGGNEHSDALRSILFVYSRTNPQVKYVQGMNEVLAPIYYVFAKDPDQGEFAEPDAYFCFANLMKEIQICFRREYDSSMLLTKHPVGQFWALLSVLDRELFVSMVRKGIDPRFFALRWLSLLFSQEMELPDVLRLWDSLFADTNRFQFLLFVACAVLIRMRDELIVTEFAPCLVKLQDLQIMDVFDVISIASQLMEPFADNPVTEEYLARKLEEAMHDERLTGEQSQKHMLDHETLHRLAKRFSWRKHSRK